MMEIIFNKLVCTVGCEIECSIYANLAPRRGLLRAPNVPHEHARDLPTACVRALRPTALMIVPMFTSRCLNLAWHAPHGPCGHKLHRARVAHGACEGAATHRARDRADVHLLLPELGVARFTCAP